jgi:hypothetical protein
MSATRAQAARRDRQALSSHHQARATRPGHTAALFSPANLAASQVREKPLRFRYLKDSNHKNRVFDLPLRRLYEPGNTAPPDGISLGYHFQRQRTVRLFNARADRHLQRR